MNTTSSTNEPGPRIVVTGIGIVSPVGCDASIILGCHCERQVRYCEDHPV